MQDRLKSGFDSLQRTEHEMTAIGFKVQAFIIFMSQMDCDILLHLGKLLFKSGCNVH